MTSSQPPMVVVFGRPGAGKTTVSEKAVELLLETNNGLVTCLDLDVCVPQWMKDNFVKGMYPTLEQRKEFAVGACNYVDEKLEAMRQSDKVIVSFSFVNTDLREDFRARFPRAKWVLVDTSDDTAQDRINQREGHFYKGAPPSEAGSNSQHDEHEKNEKDKSETDNTEWNFAPVDFDHILLDGLQSVEANAKQVIQVLNQDD